MQQSWRSNRQPQDQAGHYTKMSCPWVNNREKKSKEKTVKYVPLRWELKQQFPGYEVKQPNIIIIGDGHYNVRDCGEQK